MGNVTFYRGDPAWEWMEGVPDAWLIPDSSPLRKHFHVPEWQPRDDGSIAPARTSKSMAATLQTFRDLGGTDADPDRLIRRLSS